MTPTIKRFDPLMLWGIMITVFLHVSIVGGSLAYRRWTMAKAPASNEPSYVVAKLVRLGKPRDPKLLPRKIVSKPPTEKVPALNLSADANDRPNPPKQEAKKELSLEERLSQSFNKVETLEQAEEEIAAEGSPDGVASGTETEASEGDLYMTRIADLWNRTWSLPAIIPQEEAKTLYVLMTLKINRDGTIEFPLTIDRPSGNAHFDGSIETAWRQIAAIPLPPPERLDAMLSQGLALKLTWKGLQ